MKNEGELDLYVLSGIRPVHPSMNIKGGKVISVCAWCSKVLGEKGKDEDKRITHGVCKECAEKLLENKKGGEK